MATAKTIIITYNGIDGACAAAMAALKFPKADIVISSAKRIHARLQSFSTAKQVPSRIIVCGVGMYSDWEPVIQTGKKIRRKGGHIIWYCGRGYLKDDSEYLSQFSEPVLLDTGTNTAAICEHLDLKKHDRASFLLALAEHDENNPIADHDHKAGDKEMQWVDRLLAAISQYFKYQDETAYADAIKRLAANRWDAKDQWAMEMFRRSGFQYVLEGTSDAIKQLRRNISKVGAVNEPVLIMGESGVGKERTARLIHECSQRPTELFVPVNCATFAGNAGLANSILFGHVEGAFTGAIKDREGAFVHADGGVLFLDELGELPLEVQAKLLRVLEDGKITPEGADRSTRTVDVRVITATNRDLPAMIRRGEFRIDLFHRLSTLRIHVPTLKEHKQDIAQYAWKTLADLADEGHKRKLSKKDIEALAAYDWPGNVRQLIKLVKRAVYMDISVPSALKEECALGNLTPQEDVHAGDPIVPASANDIRPLREIQRTYTRRAWHLHNKNYAATARVLKIAENTLRGYLGQDSK